MSVNFVKAQNIGDIHNFRISYWHPGETSYVLKNVTNRQMVLNLNDTSGGKITVYYQLINSNGVSRSEDLKGSTRQTNYGDNRGEGGYIYKLKIRREYVWDGD